MSENISGGEHLRRAMLKTAVDPSIVLDTVSTTEADDANQQIPDLPTDPTQGYGSNFLSSSDMGVHFLQSAIERRVY